MPIAPAHSWSETEAALTVTATCRGATTANTDVFSSPHYVSVNAPPFFLELDLHGSIDGAASTYNYITRWSASTPTVGSSSCEI